MPSRSLAGRRVLVTGAARGIGAATVRRLHERGAHVALAGLEPALLEATAAACGGAPFWEVDVTDRARVDAAVDEAAERLGGLDVVMANAGVAAAHPMMGGNPATFERTIGVNVLGTYYTLRAAARHVAHPGGYTLAVASLAAALHLPLMGAYCASKAAVEAMADSLRTELRHTGARVGVAYFAEIDTDMTSRAFGAAAAQRLTGGGTVSGTAPLHVAIDAVERGIAARARRVAAPRWVAPLLPIREVVQRAAELQVRGRVPAAVCIAQEEDAPLTTEQPA